MNILGKDDENLGRLCCWCCFTSNTTGDVESHADTGAWDSKKPSIASILCGVIKRGWKILRKFSSDGFFPLKPHGVFLDFPAAAMFDEIIGYLRGEVFIFHIASNLRAMD